MPRFIPWTLIFAALVAVGCAQTKRTELEQVAKDWCMVIRASQVIPVYPLTEDLQPGDLFLVQVPVDKQQKVYEDRGFLPLDNMVARLNPTGYADFYEQSFGVGGEQKELPKHWLEPGKTSAWGGAPDAAFPSYKFTVRRGAGLSLALPVQGVPIGLSLLGSDAANGSITISQAGTYGVNTSSLYDDVKKWAEEKENQELLANYASTTSKKNYLRVISRIYLTSKLTVSLQDAGSVSGAVAAGAPKPVELLIPTTDRDTQRATLEAYSSNIEKLNKMIEAALRGAEGAAELAPGGTVKVVAASARSITLSHKFARPLVVGYLGFDMMIGEGGTLGPPFPTHTVLVAGLEPAGAVFTETQSQIRKLLSQVNTADDPESIRRAVIKRLAGEVETLYAMYAQYDASLPARADVFKLLIGLYLVGESGGGPHHEKLKAALEEALQ